MAIYFRLALLVISLQSLLTFWWISSNLSSVGSVDKIHKSHTDATPVLVQRPLRPPPPPRPPLSPGECPLEDVPFLYSVPNGVEKAHLWRYSSLGLYWSKCDKHYQKAKHYNQTLKLPPESVKKRIEEVCKELEAKNRFKLCRMFRNCFPNTLETTVQLLHDGTTYVITGDIPLMWLRDSAAQVHQYLPLARDDPYLQVIIEGVIRRDIKWIKIDPYGSSFRLFLDFDHKGKKELTPWDYKCGRTIHVAMHDWEVDSLCYFVKLSYDYWKATGIGTIFDTEWKEAAEKIIQTFKTEQNHNSQSNYTYPTLSNNGLGSPTCLTGLIWSGMRPSDDPCQYHYLIPANMFAVVSLWQMAEIFGTFFPEEIQAKSNCERMASEIDDAIHKKAVVEKNGVQIYAYEIDGCSKYNTIDDANLPSLLSIPYLNYTTPHDPDHTIYTNTRHFILSPGNPYYYKGKKGAGIGSVHTSSKTVWPLSIITQALTSKDPSEVNQMIDMLENTDGGKEFMHESFNMDNPNSFTREWFGWANSLFSELIMGKLDMIEKK